MDPRRLGGDRGKLLPQRSFVVVVRVPIGVLDRDLGFTDSAEAVQRLGQHGGEVRVTGGQPGVQSGEHLRAPGEVEVARGDRPGTWRIALLIQERRRGLVV